MDGKQKKIISECLAAAVSCPFFPDWEFSTLFGLERAEVARIIVTWPKSDQTKEAVDIAINNSFANLLDYPIDRPQEWPQYLSVSRAELEVIFDQWRSEREPKSKN